MGCLDEPRIWPGLFIGGQILQFGFASTASGFEGSGIFYDNVEWAQKEPISIEETNWGQVKARYR